MREADPRNVLVQEVWAEQVWAARPMTLVRESPDGALLWFPAGTRWQAPTTAHHRPRETTRGERLATSLEIGEWEFAEREWDTHTLQIWPRDAWHSIWISWRRDGSRFGFYGNVQLPYRRISRGFRTMDLVLDVIVELDGSWRLKDEDELAIFAARGVIESELERRIRDEAEAIILKLEREEPPFDGSFESWRPDPDWTLPVLPNDWSRA